MLGELGVKGKGFCSTKLQISIFSLYWACSVSDRLLVGNFWIRLRAKSLRGRWGFTRRRGERSRKADTDDGGIFFSCIFLSLSTWFKYGTHVH
jgi:hypothetical protein